MSNYKISLINRFKALKLKLEVNSDVRRSIRKRAYDVKLQKITGLLPGLKSLRRGRNILVLAAILSISIPTIQMLCFSDTMHYKANFRYSGFGNNLMGIFLYSIPILSFILSSIFTAFAAMVDFAIYRRFGNEKSFIEW